MKLLTRDTDYALRAVCCIAGKKGRAASVRDLTEDLDMPRPFLRKILQILNKEGVLTSQKGKGGGFTLVADIKKLSMFDMIEIFQGPFELSDHVFRGKICPYIDTCIMKTKLDKIEENVIRDLKAVTIASLLKDSTKPWLGKNK